MGHVEALFLGTKYFGNRKESRENSDSIFIFWQENILQKVVMTAFADRTVVTIAVSIGDNVDLLLSG